MQLGLNFEIGYVRPSRNVLKLGDLGVFIKYYRVLKINKTTK